MPQVQVLVSTQNGERDHPGRRWQRPVANLFHTERSAGRRTPRARRTRSLQSRIGNKISDGAFEAMLEAIQTDRTPNCRELFSTQRRQGATRLTPQPNSLECGGKQSATPLLQCWSAFQSGVAAAFADPAQIHYALSKRHSPVGGDIFRSFSQMMPLLTEL